MNLEAILYLFLTDVPIQGLIWALFSLGVFITYRVLNIADLSVEGVFPLSAITTLFFINIGIDPFTSILFSIVIGAFIGFINGLLHIYLKIPSLLSGIIIMISLYTVNVLISKGNIALDTGKETIFSLINNLFNHKVLTQIIVLLFFVVIVFFVVYWFFGTEYGLSLRAVGKNKTMSKANGININTRYIIGMVIANIFISLSGALWGQINKATAVDSGKGTIVIGLAIVFLGEILIRHKFTFKKSLISIIFGSLIYWFVMDIIYSIPGFNTNYTFLIQAIIITIIVSIPLIKKIHLKPKKLIIKETKND